MALKMWFIVGNVLNANRAFTRDNLFDPVDKKEWVPMRNDPLNNINIGYRKFIRHVSPLSFT